MQTTQVDLLGSLSPQDCGQTSDSNGRPGSHELATDNTSFTRSLKGSTADDGGVSGACTAISFKVHELKIAFAYDQAL